MFPRKYASSSMLSFVLSHRLPVQLSPTNERDGQCCGGYRRTTRQQTNPWSVKSRTRQLAEIFDL